MLLADPDGPAREALLSKIRELDTPRPTVAALTSTPFASKHQPPLIRESALGQQLRRILASNVVDNIDDFAAIAGVANDQDFRRHCAHASEGFADLAQDETRYLNPEQCRPGGSRSVVLRGRLERQHQADRRAGYRVH